MHHPHVDMHENLCGLCLTGWLSITINMWCVAMCYTSVFGGALVGLCAGWEWPVLKCTAVCAFLCVQEVDVTHSCPCCEVSKCWLGWCGVLCYDGVCRTVLHGDSFHVSLACNLQNFSMANRGFCSWESKA